MLKLTLDMNCLIDLDNHEPREGTVHVKWLVEKSLQQEVDLAICASCASERQIGGSHLTNFSEFKRRLERAGLDHITLLRPIGVIGMSFIGYSIYAKSEDLERENEIFRTLFPASSPSWAETAGLAGLSIDARDSKAYRDWRNKKCDAQAFWAHEQNARDVFVTSDANFSKRFLDEWILTPAQATAALL
jgi:hypothetical protein